jgi:serine/threonine-protein kinase HipA
MSAAPYPEFPLQKVKLAMALGDKGYYRLSQIQYRHFYQTGQKAGLHEQDMESIVSDLATRMEGAIAEAAALAVDANMPESTSGPILAGVSKRAGMIRME